MDISLHIPWTNEALQELLLKILKTGEAAKIDFKTVWDITSATQKAELARDIQAMANSVEPAYNNHGFLIFGVTGGEIVPAGFSQTPDQMQATVDQIVREQIGPFVPTHVRHFVANGKTWGVIVVPPSRNAPHICLRDTPRYGRGDVWLRVGTTSSKAAPEDFARFFRTHLDDYGRELRDEMREMRREFEKQIARGASRRSRAHVEKSPEESLSTPCVQAQPIGLLNTVRDVLRKKGDPVSDSLEQEALSIQAFLESHAIPWDLNNITKESGSAAIEKINDKASEFWKTIAILVERDDAGAYEDDVIEALKTLAVIPSAPAGTSFTRFGTGIRMYPLMMALYIAFMLGIRKGRSGLLTKVMAIEMTPRSTYEDSEPIGGALYHSRDAAGVFQAMNPNYPQKWCDSIGSYFKQWIEAHVYPELPKADRNGHMFYVGEFVLSLLTAAWDGLGRPAPGLFFYTSDSARPIQKFLQTEKSLLTTLFGTNLRPALERFDEWGSKIAHAGGCWGDGFQRGAVDIVYPKATVVEAL